MKKHLHKFETTMWLFIKFVLYTSLMAVFIIVLGRDTIGLTRLSRTLGITVSTFGVVGMLFLSVYGSYDVGRRKSKPIINSMILAVLCTDIITYLQVQIMKTNGSSIIEFRIGKVWLLAVILFVQFLIIYIFTYME